MIATTNKTLLCEQDRFLKGYKGELPQPSPQFIEKYIESYNSGNIITEVMVEYEPFRMTIHTGKRYEENIK